MSETNQQNLDKRGNNPEGKGGFKKGYDPRRWLSGRGKKSPEQREGEQILLAVIWEELSREFDTGTMKPLEQSETIDALRLMVRSWIKKKPELIAERIAGKVTEKHDITSGGQPLTKEADDTRAEILRKLDSIATATGAGKDAGQSDG
jgi:hypothetical protein